MVDARDPRRERNPIPGTAAVEDGRREFRSEDMNMDGLGLHLPCVEF